MTPRLEGLDFTLRPIGGEERTTTCDFQIFIDASVVWPAYQQPDVSLEIQIDDLLSHLTEFWKPLMLRQVYPIDVKPFRPSEFRRDAERRWSSMPDALVEHEDYIVSSFEEAHDLSRAFAGFYGLPHFWMMRSGNQFYIETQGQTKVCPFKDIMMSLSHIGDHISNLLLDSNPERWGMAVDAWKQRDEADGSSLLAWSAGLDRRLAEDLIQEGFLTSPSSFDDAVNDNDELRIAARMAGALPDQQIREILSIARSIPKNEAPELSALAKDTADYLLSRNAAHKPFVQGEIAALFVRDRLGLSHGNKIDVFAIARSLGIFVNTTIQKPNILHGLAIWGASHGPGVFLNGAIEKKRHETGNTIDNNLYARVTLAHEMCHLLLDGNEAATAIEVLKARMPVGVEQRAKSFAGEFLLPTQMAGEKWINAGKPTGRSGIASIVRSLSQEYGVTISVAAWKIEHGAAAYDAHLGQMLDSLFPVR